jgi:hypothetical protein
MSRGVGMAKSDSRPGINQLSFQRKWLMARLEHGELSPEDAATCLEDIEDLDLKSAATPCANVQDLCLKLEHLKDLFYPARDATPEDCLEHVMLVSVLKDARALAANRRDPEPHSNEQSLILGTS